VGAGIKPPLFEARPWICDGDLAGRRLNDSDTIDQKLTIDLESVNIPHPRQQLSICATQAGNFIGGDFL
jgi:hypothetical protein